MLPSRQKKRALSVGRNELIDSNHSIYSPLRAVSPLPPLPSPSVCLQVTAAKDGAARVHSVGVITPFQWMGGREAGRQAGAATMQNSITDDGRGRGMLEIFTPEFHSFSLAVWHLKLAMNRWMPTSRVLSLTLTCMGSLLLTSLSPSLVPLIFVIHPLTVFPMLLRCVFFHFPLETRGFDLFFWRILSATTNTS